MFGRTASYLLTAVVFAVLGWQIASNQVVRKHDLGDQQCMTSKPDCKITVTVDCPYILQCYTSVDFEMTRVTADSKKGNTITWALAESRYEFDSRGISFPDGSGFTNCQPSNNNKKFTCENASQGGLYKYTVKVKDLDPLDPWVFNN